MALGPKRPRDPNQAAKQLIDIIAGEVEDTLSEAKRNRAAKGRAGGRSGGAARAKALTALERRAIAKTAAQARWKKKTSS
jgi:hypothetical protein